MCDVVDLDLDDSPQTPVRPAFPSSQDLKAALEAHLTGRDLSTLSLKVLRRELEQRLNLPEGALQPKKDELKALASAFAQAQVAPAPAPVAATNSPPKTEEPPSKRRRSGILLGAAGNDASLPDSGKSVIGAVVAAGALPSGTAASAPKTKKKAPVSAYSLWGNDNRARLAQEHEATAGTKASFGDMCKALSAGWKQVSTEERELYEQKAAKARAEAAAASPQESDSAGAPKTTKPPKSQKEPKAGKGKGKGKGKEGSNSSVTLTRAEFLRAAQTMRCSLHVGDASAEQKDDPPLGTLVCKPRLFKSGGAGWFQLTDADVTIGGQLVRVRAQLNILVPSSKHWEDGEGLAEAMASIGAGGDSKDGPEATNAMDVDAQPPADADATTAVAADETVCEATVEI